MTPDLAGSDVHTATWPHLLDSVWCEVHSSGAMLLPTAKPSSHVQKGNTASLGTSPGMHTHQTAMPHLLVLVHTLVFVARRVS